MLMQLKTFEEHPLVNIAEAEPPVDETAAEITDKKTVMDQSAVTSLVERFKRCYQPG